MQSLQKIIVALLTIGSLVLVFAFTISSKESYPSEAITQLYFKKLTGVSSKLEKFQKQLIDQKKSDEKLLRTYLEIRKSYKEIEFIAEHMDQSYIKKFINGAPLPTVVPHIPELNVHEPEGLQVIDEFFAEDKLNREEMVGFVVLLLKNMRRMEHYHQQIKLTDRLFFEATRNQLIRIATLGITGFDTPGTASGLKDAKASIEFIKQCFSFYENFENKSSESKRKEVIQALDKAITYLEANQDFETFDRFGFIKNHINPLYKLILEYHLETGIETIDEITNAKQAVNYLSTNIFAKDFLNTSFYIDQTDGLDYSEAEALGELLFFDPILSANNKRSCASCHQPQKAFTDGQKKSLAFNFEGELKRNSPTLVNAIYADRFFWDLRSLEIESQVEHVVHSHDEFNTNFIDMAVKISKSNEYKERFETVFPKLQKPINKYTISFALAAYVKTLTSHQSKFDKNIRGEEKTFTKEEKLGFNIFMGKGACGTCHFAPTFAGLVPPLYRENESEVLGVPLQPDTINAMVDTDEGRIASGVIKEAAPFYKYSFKTVTVRNIALTGPYMHNGVYESIDEVIDFYNRGGGKGIGIHLEHQTLPFDELSLSKKEQAAVKAFLLTLTDTSGLTHVPNKLPVFENQKDWSDRKIGGEY